MGIREKVADLSLVSTILQAITLFVSITALCNIRYIEEIPDDSGIQIQNEMPVYDRK